MASVILNLDQPDFEKALSRGHNLAVALKIVLRSYHKDIIENQNPFFDFGIEGEYEEIEENEE